MTPSKRHEQILEKLRLDGQVRVCQLAHEFGVTEDCIRKDLALLSAENRLERIHGGAIPTRNNPHALQPEDRMNLREEEKRKIAKKAMQTLRPGMTVFLDISAINLDLARLIYESRMPVRVVTNMSGVMKIFSAPSSAELIFLGGTFNHAHDGFAGSMTIDQIRRFRFDAAFLGSVGLSLEDGTVSTSDPEDGLTKQAVLEQSETAYLLSEQDKLSRRGKYHYARLREFDGWICERPLSESEQIQAAACGLRVF